MPELLSELLLARLMLAVLIARRLPGFYPMSGSNGLPLGFWGLPTGFWCCRSDFRQDLCSHKHQGERGGLGGGLAVMLRLRVRHGVSCSWFLCTERVGGRSRGTAWRC